MSDISWIITYSGLVLLASLLGAFLPFVGRVSHARLQLYLSLSAGVMLGASFFHVLPEAVEKSGAYFGWWMSLGVVGLFCIERFIAPHSHEIPRQSVPGAAQETGHDHAHHHHGHEHHHHEHHDDVRQAAPAVAGWMAVLGLTIHTFMNGVALAAAVHAVEHAPAGEPDSHAWSAFPGLAMFLAIVLHKPADALAISMVLRRKGVSKQVLGMVQVGFALMVAAGAFTFLKIESIEKDLDNQITGAALAFSAGTFLFIALSDLLPEVQFHTHDRGLLFSALVLGVVFMGCIGLLEGHDHDGHGAPKPGEAPAQPHVHEGPGH